MNYLFRFLGQTNPKVSEVTVGHTRPQASEAARQTRPQAARAAVGLAPPKGALNFFVALLFSLPLSFLPLVVRFATVLLGILTFHLHANL